MKVFCCVFHDQEMMSDVFDFTLDHYDVIMKVQGRYKAAEAIGDVDIGCGSAFEVQNKDDDEDNGGPSGGSASTQVLDVEYNFGLTETSYSKKEFIVIIRAYLANVKKHLTDTGKADRVEVFQKGANEFCKKIVGDDYENWKIYLPRNESDQGSLAFSFWEDESGPGPMFYFFKDALKEVKC